MSSYQYLIELMEDAQKNEEKAVRYYSKLINYIEQNFPSSKKYIKLRNKISEIMKEELTHSFELEEILKNL